MRQRVGGASVGGASAGSGMPPAGPGPAAGAVRGPGTERHNGRRPAEAAPGGLLSSPVDGQPGFELAPDDPLRAFLLDQAGAVDITGLDLASPALAALRDAHVELVVPLISSGTLIGLLNLGPRLSERG